MMKLRASISRKSTFRNSNCRSLAPQNGRLSGFFNPVGIQPWNLRTAFGLEGDANRPIVPAEKLESPRVGSCDLMSLP